ncbi:MAG TPA: YdcF family protein, partial [Pseudolabrys sp.]|nr:YdcF family protein [Pseudolabrys sp.]
MLAGFARWIGFLTMAAGATGALLLAGGFGWFVAQIAGDEITLDRKADGIVALTGAAARIPDAIELLATEHGKRLLITGVYRATSAREIARITPLYSKYFTCCIDLDRSALNTFGNALETKRWARQHNFNSLIVVTSNWHMP